MRTLSSGVSWQKNQVTAKPSFLEYICSTFSAKVAAACLAFWVTQAANANINSCTNTSDLFKEVQAAGETFPSQKTAIVTPANISVSSEKGATILTYKLDIAKEIRETPSTFNAEIKGKLAEVTTREWGSLNFRNENGEVVRTLPDGKQLILSGEQKETKAGTFVKTRFGKGWIALQYLALPETVVASDETLQSIPSPAASRPVTQTVKTPTSLKKSTSQASVEIPQTTAKIWSKKTKTPVVLTEEDRAKFQEVEQELLKKAASLGLHIPSFKLAIAVNEGSGSYTQSNEALAKQLGIDASQAALGRYQFIPGTRSNVNRAFFGKNRSELHSLFRKSAEFQEAMMDGLTSLNIDSMFADSYLSSAIENKKVSPTFVLSAMHYSGIKGAKSAVRAVLAGKTLTGKTDWMGKTDIFTYAATAEATYNENAPSRVAEVSKPETVATNIIDAPKAESSEKEASSAQIIPISFEKKAEQTHSTAKKSTLSAKEESAIRSNLSSYIHRAQWDLIAAKAQYRKAGDLGNLQMITDFILASERRINAIQTTESVPRYYKETISALETAIKNAPNQAVLAKNQYHLMMVKKEFSYVLSLVKQISSGELSIEKPAILVRNNTVYAMDSVMKKAA